MAKITIKDVAKQAGVSITAVSQILNNKGTRFSSKTQQKVKQAQIDLGYVPDFNAQSLSSQTSHTIGVLVPELGNPFFSELISGIQAVAGQDGYVPLIFDFENNVQLAQQYLAELVKRAADGMIIASDLLSNAEIAHVLGANRIPYILLDQNSIEAGDRIMVDDNAGGKMVAQYLIQKGHQNVAIVMPANPTVNVQKRLTGFNEVYQEHNLPAIQVIEAPMNKLGGLDASSKVIEAGVTGIFAINDEVAIGLYKGLKERGYRIPADYSIIGYDDIDLAQYVDPTLTTIQQSIRTIGQKSAELILKRIEKSADRKSIQINLPVQLIERNSVMQNRKK